MRRPRMVDRCQVTVINLHWCYRRSAGLDTLSPVSTGVLARLVGGVYLVVDITVELHDL